MASALNSEHHEYFPQRSENILNPDLVAHHQDEIVQPIPPTSDSSTDVDPSLQPSRTNETIREREFGQIRPGDREQLEKIASNFGGSQLGRTLTKSTDRNHGLEKQHTLTGVKLGDSTLDPSSPDFDVIRWTKM